MEIQLPEKVSYIIQMLQSHGYCAYAVGGCVRDSLLGRMPEDWDITTSALPHQVKAIFPKTFDTGIQHGTVTVLIAHEGFEVTTYRIDGEYEDMRHPNQVQFTDDLLCDLKRRDFTINAMAYNQEKGLVDAFGGREDLERGIIRCVGMATERFKEDALRIVRGVRFAAQLGFGIDGQTMSAMQKLAPNLACISAERIQVELVKLLVSPHPELLRTAWELGITNIILPEFDSMMQTKQHNPHHLYNVGEHTLKALTHIEADRVLRLAVLFHDAGKPDTESIDENGISHFYEHAEKSAELTRVIMKRLKFDNDTLYRTMRLVKWHDYRFAEGMRGVRRAVNRTGEDIFLDLLKVMRADVLAQSTYMQQEKLEELQRIKRAYEEIKQQEECLSLKDLAVDGRMLMEAGVPKGRQVGKVLSALLELVLDDPSLNTKEQLLALVPQLL